MSGRIACVWIGSERLQETNAFTFGPASKSRIPVAQGGSQFIAQFRQVKQLRFNIRQLLARESSHLLARRASLISNLENRGEFVECEHYRKRATDKLNSLKSFGWILAITIG